MKLFLRTIIFIIFSANAFAASIIRDAEIENVVREISTPIFRAANLNPDSINIYIVNDKEINAYVSGGNNMFINTGLLGMSDDPNMLTGVIAHETGHIAGGHLLRSVDEYKGTALKTTLGYMVGLAAAAAGSPQAGVAIASGAGHVALRQQLKHTRTHEESADQAALNYLDKTGQSAKGLADLLEVLYGKEAGLSGNLNPYTLTHPLSRERISHVKDHMSKSRYANAKTPEKIATDFSRAITKLNAFLLPPENTLRKYPESDTSINARYARSIAYYKIPDIAKSLEEIDTLIKLQPENPFFHELKGQILYENGKVKESVPNYEKAVNLLPQSPLLKIMLATSQISSEEEPQRKKAINNLEQAIVKEPYNSFAWNQLAIAYGRGGDIGMSNLALAEEAALTGRKKDARKFIDMAKDHIKEGSPAAQRLKDIQTTVDIEKK